MEGEREREEEEDGGGFGTRIEVNEANLVPVLGLDPILSDPPGIRGFGGDDEVNTVTDVRIAES